MRSTKEIGLKIIRSQRECFRYLGVSAEPEQRGAGTSRPEVAGVCRTRQSEELSSLRKISRPAEQPEEDLITSPPPWADQ